MTKKFTRALALLLTLVLTLSTIPGSVAAVGEEVTEEDIYVFDRDANGNYLYLYQSPCMLGYDLNKKYGGNGVPIQAFVFNMYNTRDNEYFPTYCTDIHINPVKGADYHRLNLEDSTFSANAADLIRAILMEGFYINPIEYASDETAHKAAADAKAASLGNASGVTDLTVGEAIAATQAAIWKAAPAEQKAQNILNPQKAPAPGAFCPICSIAVNRQIW